MTGRVGDTRCTRCPAAADVSARPRRAKAYSAHVARSIALRSFLFFFFPPPQNLANGGAVFGAKEPFMEPMNNWVKSNHARMVAILDEAGRCAAPAAQDSLDLGAQDLPRCYSALQAMLEQHILPTAVRAPPSSSPSAQTRTFSVAACRQGASQYHCPRSCTRPNH